MKIKELIKQLLQTDLNNEVRIIGKCNYTAEVGLSFDDNGDVLIYETAK